MFYYRMKVMVPRSEGHVTSALLIGQRCLTLLWQNYRKVE
jgi:hypothetical protein